MLGWHDEKGGSKVFWFQETKAGNQKLIRPDGTSRIMKKKHEHFAELGKQALAGWQRAKLLMDEYGIWDATAFGCTMNIESMKTNAGTRKIPMTEDVYRMFQAILEDRPTDIPEIMINGYVGFLFRDKNGMPEVALH